MYDLENLGQCQGLQQSNDTIRCQISTFINLIPRIFTLANNNNNIIIIININKTKINSININNNTMTFY